jgi:hypothetical protein
MKIWRSVGIVIGLLICTLVIVELAFAELIFVGVVDLNGTGFGAVETVLTMQALPANPRTSFESGCVGVNGSGSTATGPSECVGVNLGGDEKPGFVHNSTPLVTNAFELTIIFNTDEPAGESITLDNLVMSLSNSSGEVGFESGDWLTPLTFDPTEQGIGRSGFAFELTDAQAAQANIAIAAGFNRLGLSSTAAEARAGPETFFLLQAPEQDVPEPSTLSMVGAALSLVIWGRRRGRRFAL